MSSEKTIDHSSRKHAVLSASGASRWLNCTVSPRLEEGFESKDSPFAAEGTLAHEFAELNLKLQLGLIEETEYLGLVAPFKESEYYSEEMEEEVQKHVDYVIEQLTEARRITPDAKLLIEEKVDLTFFIEDGFGTCDVVIIADGVLEVIDLKFGKGVRVKSEDNSQLKLYGLGALRAFELAYDIHTVRLSVTQPRLDSISSWEMPAATLNSWGDEVVKPKAALAYAGGGEQVPGDWCRFCKAKPRCKALADQNLAVLKHEFRDPLLLTDEELIDAYKISSQISDWISGISDFLLSEALKGKKWPEYKLVEGRSNRVIKDEAGVTGTLEDNLYTKEQFTNSKLKGIGDLEKLLGKKRFEEILGAYVDKPAGKPTLAHESDKRPEMGIEQAKVDFAD